ncbi:hypothetical protein CH373_13090 [Leptospira perolatii]|uniref:Uncharacterized protein n=1 Tax=Leptospira perolatii TaxID=2023191 RepID=A0A2M9ZKY1_9LEPT|nr:hypothetical protein [Leptospira perolatii]PJZ69951.1 hypothetical protein CH360_08595 [Leptospira perolatii]PJZ72641.1 hypothetical protein CH373_13090 [Leptospira perolatii]
MENQDKHKLEEEISRRLDSSDWSVQMSESILRKKKTNRLRWMAIASTCSLAIGLLAFVSIQTRSEESEVTQTELRLLVEEQIEGTFVDAESGMKNTGYSEDQMLEDQVSSPLFDVDELIETSFQRR